MCHSEREPQPSLPRSAEVALGWFSAFESKNLFVTLNARTEKDRSTREFEAPHFLPGVLLPRLLRCSFFADLPNPFFPISLLQVPNIRCRQNEHAIGTQPRHFQQGSVGSFGLLDKR